MGGSERRLSVANSEFLRKHFRLDRSSVLNTDGVLQSNAPVVRRCTSSARAWAAVVTCTARGRRRMSPVQRTPHLSIIQLSKLDRGSDRPLEVEEVRCFLSYVESRASVAMPSCGWIGCLVHRFRELSTRFELHVVRQLRCATQVKHRRVERRDQTPVPVLRAGRTNRLARPRRV